MWDDDTTHIHYDFLNGTTRPCTAAEIAAGTERAGASAAAQNRQTLITQATAAMQTNRNFLAITAPTSAQMLAQARAMAQQLNTLNRMAVNDLTGTD